MLVEEVLLAAVADTVVAILAQTFDAEAKLRRLFKREIDTEAPAKLAYQRALVRTYTAFARNYPDLSGYIFTEPFLLKEAAPLLAKVLERDGVRAVDRNANEFAHLWVNTTRHQATALCGSDGKPQPIVIEASRNFLHWLNSELRREPIFQPLFDSRALDQLDHLPEISALLTQLHRDLSKAQKDALVYEPIVNTIANGFVAQSSVSAGGDVVGRDKITTSYFYGSFVKLSDLYLSPAELFKRRQVHRFVGRRQLMSKIDAFINNPSRTSGVFLVEGEAGMGKTALLGHLVQTRGYLHVFGDQFEGETQRLEAVRSLAAQLASRYHLIDYENILFDLAGTNAVLENLLKRAAEQLVAGERIVIVADALDQAGTPPQGVNPFGLPKFLPDGVFIIASQRPVTVRFDCEAERVVESFDASENRSDIREHLAEVASTETIRIQLNNKGYSVEKFVETLAEKSEGNWMYLHYVLDEIENGKRAPLNLDELPTGLTQYYYRYWRTWKHGTHGKGEKAWRDLYAPTLGMIAAAQTALTVEQLVNWAGIPISTDELTDLLEDEWRAFVSVSSDRHGQTVYRFYHASLQRMMRGETEPQALAALDHQGKRLVEGLRTSTLGAHRKIIERLRTQCGGEWIRLVEDDYARRYLVTHLNAIAPDEMFRLVALSDSWAKARFHKEATYVGYLNDLDVAWRFVESKDNWHIGRQIRCALIKSSLAALTQNVSGDLLKLLANSSIWSPQKVLDFVQEVANPWMQLDMIREVLPELPEWAQQQAFEIIGLLPNDFLIESATDIAELIKIMPELKQIPLIQRFVVDTGFIDKCILELTKDADGSPVTQVLKVMAQEPGVALAVADRLEHTRSLSLTLSDAIN